MFLLSSYGSSSLGHHPRFYVSFLFVSLVSHHWDNIICSSSVYSLFILFLIIGTPSQVVSKLNRLFLFFSSLGTIKGSTSVYSFYSFGLECPQMLYLSFLFVTSVSHHWDTIQIPISFYSQFMLCMICGMVSQILFKLNRLFHWFLIIWMLA